MARILILSSVIQALLVVSAISVKATQKTTTNLSTDKSSLNALKSHVTSDPKNVLKNGWSDSTFVCNWTGVTCGGDPLRVVGFNLSFAGLVGTVPPHLGNLSSLIALSLGNNSFHGVLPSELSRLRRLEYMSLGDNELEGNIPSSLGSLPKLKGLFLFGNRFSGSIPFTFSNSTSLQALVLHTNRLSGQVPWFLFKMSSLKWINLAINGFSGTIPDNICQNLPLMEGLNLGGNQLSGPIPTKLWQCKELRFLRLFFNGFTGEIPRSIGNLTKLRELYLANNKLTGIIPNEIGNLHDLEILQLIDNVLSGTIPSFLFNMPSLKTLWLSKNNFFESSLPDNIRNLTAIERLFLGRVNLKGRVPSILFNMSSLKVIDISANGLVGTIPDNICQYLPLIQNIQFGHNLLSGPLPTKLWQCKDLQVLVLGFNNFSGNIPPNIANLTNLRELHLGENKLTGGLPSKLGQWTPNLEVIRMYENDLSGPIPKHISNASKLVHIAFGGNHFSGFVPNALGDLKKLQWLSIYTNNLTMKSNLLSTILTTLPDLRFLDLSFNPINAKLPSSVGLNRSVHLERLYLIKCNLRGDIPVAMANFSSLMIFNVSRNGMLSGSIPSSIGNLQGLQALDLSDNALVGPIPLQLCQLKRLYALHLGNNLLSGPIPTCLGNTSSIRELSLKSNKFTSEIPPTLWGGLQDALYVDLSHNYLTGHLSPGIEKLKAATTIDVSNNQLSGNISSSIGSLDSLISLTLANNKFQGHIPDSFGNLLSLERLDLSNNNLSGAIPKSLEKLSHLKFLNLSFNKLYGEIPSGGPFRNFSSQSFIQNYGLCGEPRLQVPQCKYASRKPNKAWVLRYVVPCILLAIISFALLIIVFCWKRNKKSNSEPTVVAFDEEAFNNVFRMRVTRVELSTATNAFSTENLLGTGGFGSVYKGTLSDGLTFAIKVFNLEVEEAFESFATECEVLCGICHRNLVKIVTCCSSPDFKALVLEYMPHGSLEKWLYANGFSLNILQRLNIMIDVASALEYLHHGYTTPIVHCDLKPSNVLLDEDMVAHVADFGIAKIMSGEDSMTRTITLATIGYMAPEYGVGGVVSQKGDVYSFGIMLMEILTKKKPVDEMFSEKMNMRQWIADSLPHSIDQVICQDLLNPYNKQGFINKDCISSIMELALACTDSSPEKRTDMKEVVTTLIKIKMKFFPNDDL